MTSEVTRYGTGERGVFKLDVPKYEPTKVNSDMIHREIERGEWRYDLAGNRLVPVESQRKEVDAPFVITDEIDPTLSMTGTDKVYTSKARLRREYKDLGFIETGGEHAKPARKDKEQYRKELRDSVAKALNDNKYGMAPMTELEKENSKREEREWQAYQKRMKGF